MTGGRSLPGEALSELEQTLAVSLAHSNVLLHSNVVVKHPGCDLRGRLLATCIGVT